MIQAEQENKQHYRAIVDSPKIRDGFGQINVQIRIGMFRLWISTPKVDPLSKLREEEKSRYAYMDAWKLHQPKANSIGIVRGISRKLTAARKKNMETDRRCRQKAQPLLDLLKRANWLKIHPHCIWQFLCCFLLQSPLASFTVNPSLQII